MIANNIPEEDTDDSVTFTHPIGLYSRHVVLEVSESWGESLAFVDEVAWSMVHKGIPVTPESLHEHIVERKTAELRRSQRLHLKELKEEGRSQEKKTKGLLRQKLRQAERHCGMRRVTRRPVGHGRR